MMDNAEEIMQSLEEFSKIKPKVIPRELEDYLGYVAKSGDPVFKWSLVKFLFREKMLSVINDFYEDTLTIELPPCPNVDAFNYDRMKSCLLERLESFHGAPFTIQRICELLTNPRKEYNRADKFMRAIEKNILVVSTREPGRYSDIDCETTQECSINGIRDVGDSLDSTFIINDLGAGPDSSSPNSDLSDSLPDANHLNTVQRVSPVHDQEVSSDSDDNILDNGQDSSERPPEKTNGLENQHNMLLDEAHVSNVSSSEMSLSLEANNLNGVNCDENTGNSVTSSHESVISNQQVGFVVGSSLGEVMGTVESSPVESLESCILPDGSLLNEVINQPINEPASADVKVSEPSQELTDVNKSDESESNESAINQSDSVNEETPETNIDGVECDTSQNQDDSKCEDSLIPNSSINVNEIPCSISEPVSSCDTTESNSELASDYCIDSGEVLNEQPDVSPTSMMPQSEVLSQSDSEVQENILAQSNVIDQSDIPQSESDTVTTLEKNSHPDTDASSSVMPQSDSDDNVTPSEAATTDTTSQSGNVDQSDATSPFHTSPDSGVLAQSDLIDQSDSTLSGSMQLENRETAFTLNNSASINMSVELGLSSNSNLDEAEISEKSPDVQSCTIATSEDVSPSEPMAQSSVSNESECSIPDQTENIIQMDIPCDSENIIEPAQSNQPDSVTSEPMDVDE